MPKAVKVAVPIVVVVGFIWLIFSPPARVGYAPQQPINYSHKLHAGDYKIDCQYCHTGVTTSPKAGVPSLNVCMNCHASVGFGKPEVAKVQKYWKDKQSPEWVRVHNMPDHVRFSHAPHIKAFLKEGEPSKKACELCHGDVASMEVVAQVKPHNMGWCVNCHRDNADKGGDISCSTCHY